MEESNTPYLPKILRSQWIPESASVGSGEKCCGISFLVSTPVGFPSPMPFQSWYADFDKFYRKIQAEFKGQFKYVCK